MAFVSLEFPPGIFRNGTRRQAKGRWYDANLVRWYGGAMQPVGGWDSLQFTSPDVVIPIAAAETFADDDVGVPSNWTAVKDGGINEMHFDIAADAAAKYGQWLRVWGTNNLFMTGFVYWNDGPQLADGEVLALVRHHAGGGGAKMGVIVRFDPNGTSSSGVVLKLDFGSNTWGLRQWNSGTQTGFSGASDVSVTLDDDTDYWIRFNFNGQDYKASVWQDGATEPADWQFEYTSTDSEVTAAGYLGVIVDHFVGDGITGTDDAGYVHGLSYTDTPSETAADPEATTSAPDIGGTISTMFAWRTNENVPYLAIGTPTALYLFSEGILFQLTTAGFTGGTGDASSEISGYGTGAYGAGVYNEGVEQSVGTILEAQSWQFDNFGQDVVMVAHSDGYIRRWSPTFTSPIASIVNNAPEDNLGVVVTPERFLVALGAGGDPRSVQWADQETVDVWTPTTENQAGDFPLSSSGNILAGARGRGETLIWTTQDIFSMQYIGGTLVYAFNQVGANCGMIGRQAYAMVDGSRALWMGENSFFIYDGSVRPIDCEVSDYVFSDLNRTQASKIHTVVWPEFNEVWWFYPSAASDTIDRYVVLNYDESHWNIGQLNRTAGVPRGIFAYPILSDDSGKLYYHENGEVYLDTDGETALLPYAESGPFTIGEGDHTMWVREIIPDEKTLGDVQAYLTSRLYPTSADQVNGPYTLANPTSTRISGRQVALKVEQVSPGWRVGIPRLDVVPAGRR